MAVEWDVAGDGTYERSDCNGTQERVTVETIHAYRPGTYFPSFRVGSHRDGHHGNPPFPRNNARVRVVITE